MKEYLASSKLSPIELAKHLMVFKSSADTKKDFEQIIKSLVSEDQTERVGQIIRGLEQEDEFAILCKLMGTCESISKVGQSPIIDTDEIAPDFIASFSPGCSVSGKEKEDINLKYQCFIEVKSSKNKIFKISARDLKRRKKFSSRFKLPLIFAVRFTMFEGHGIWVLVDSSKLAKSGRRIEVSDFIGNLNHVLFDDYGVYTHPNLYVAHYYDSNFEGPGITHGDHGALDRTVFLFPDEPSIVVDENDQVLVNAFLDNFEFKQVKVERESNITCVISSVGSQSRFLSDILFFVNHLAIDEYGETSFDASRAIARMDSKDNSIPLVGREMIEYVMQMMNSKKEMFFKIAMGKPETQERILHNLKKHR